MGWTFYSASGEAMIEDGAMSIANNTNNRVVTATGTDPASLNGEANLTFDGEHLTVSDGNLVIGTSGHGIDFSAQTGTGSGTVGPELLDHYEEGSFTPLLGDGTNSNATQVLNIGRYTRIGNRCQFAIHLSISALNSVSGGLIISGWPFTSVNITGFVQSYSIGQAGGLAVTAGQSVTAALYPNVTFCYLGIWSQTTGSSGFQSGELSDDGYINFTGVYQTA